ncbi:LytR/AlgR family response regulator transcription factor [Flavilitoribacter nigricans]|uniref:DNA-binding response regulator n=1 Tax=Flavilitoribacter nigricans (strain ATCC 23147 / DSM 23189 / NBRC 102662 / NCIMB 1420 / SS-2) TaxID=1122177 RepID=A0A2D0N4C9_FLAN2|nr:LytTR family DNA-binding domain-containing protein [Flavilitoribacter nigricans]PHN03345.1 DNA-binding response regulator [Flavilitoribacter nigricans DSM 23189 = NBRC 102662]
MKCLIVDDNPLARLALKKMLGGVADLILIGECENAMAAYNLLQKEPADVLFLDVEMPGMSGLDLLKSLDYQPQVVLITSKKDYAADGFDLEVVDYIVKPVEMPRLLKAVQRARDRWIQAGGSGQEGTGSTIFIRVNNQLLSVRYEDILQVQALGDYVVFVTADKKYPVHLTMKVVEERLPADRFLRVHRSHIVAVDKITNLEQNSLLIDDQVVPVSEGYKKALMERLNIF